MRFFIGITPSEKTSLTLSDYVVNVDYHLPNPSSLSAKSFKVPGANVAYTDERYAYTAPRLGFVWRPTAAIALRASAGGGFAEAPLVYLLGANSTCAPSAVTCSISVQNINLQPEKSFGFDVGADIRLRHSTVLSFDLYRTNLFGQFYKSTLSTGIGTCPATGGGFNAIAPCYVLQYGNLGLSRYEGALLDVRHDVPHGMYWSLSGGLTRGYVVSVPGGFYNTATCTNCTNLNVVPGINFNGTFASSIPYAQGLGSIGYRWNASKYADIVATYYGNNNAYYRPAFMEVDGHLGYPLTKSVSLLMTFRNITGAYDGPVTLVAPATGAPQLGGAPPYGLKGLNYGPRTVIVTGQFHL
jgi:outer membrane receptor protein involved in Fe transport